MFKIDKESYIEKKKLKIDFLYKQVNTKKRLDWYLY